MIHIIKQEPNKPKLQCIKISIYLKKHTKSKILIISYISNKINI